MNLSDLKHIEKTTKSWVMVFVVDKWEVINSEADAMLQALHSRSIWWIKSHLKVLEEKWANDFMSRFYVGYWHKSIWDCGSMTIFVEWISMLAAKAIQDSKLYNWQESSTRYIDFSEQKMINIAWNDKWNKILEKQREFYLEILDPIEKNLKNLFPRWEWESENLHNKAIKAKAFDVARWFLPAWTSTNLAWHNNLRQIADRIFYLRNHPLQEVREIAETIQEAVMEKYPNSFSWKKYEDSENYIKKCSESYYYHNPKCEKLKVLKDDLDKEELNSQIEIFNSRPNAKTELPMWVNNIWTMKFEFPLDFWSFRDVQRHRAIFQRMPLLTTEIWFNQWYFSQLPENLKEKTQKYLNEIENLTNELNLSKEEKQYYIPMWYNISNQIMWTLPWMIYMLELRSTQYVHPTLRSVAQNIWKYIEDTHNIKMFIEKSEYDFDINRGKHDITMN